MSVTFEFRAILNGTLTDATSVVFSDETTSYGVRRKDTLAEVVAAGTALTKDAVGIYSHSFTEPSSPLNYDYAYKFVHASKTYYQTFSKNTVSAGQTITNTIVIPSIQYYTSQAEVLRVLGDYGLDLLLEDFEEVNRGSVWADILFDVTQTINLYVSQHYDPATLKTNQWTRRTATILAVSILSQRRGNAPLFVDRVDRIYTELDDIRSFRLHIPNAGTRATTGPIVRNYRMETRRRYHPMRVRQSASTGDGYAGEDISFEPFWY